MISELLTIIIPTRNRPDFLELCLRSVFESQSIVPHVIVSDNSTSDQPVINILQTKYRFGYVRQSGKLTQVEHFNACLKISPSQWVLLLHDDDELYPDSVKELQPFLERLENAGLAIGGIEHIGQEGEARGCWIPKHNGVFREEDGLLRLGLDGCAYPPATVFRSEASRRLGGFIGIDGVASDHVLALQLAKSDGVAFFNQIVGRYRSGPQQIFHVSTAEQAEAWVEFTVREAELMRRSISCSVDILDQLVDYRTWWIFLMVAPHCVKTDLSLAWRLTRKCLRVSPTPGEWLSRAKKEYPFLFSRLRRATWPVFQTAKAAVPASFRRWFRTQQHASPSR
jgi:glycosyltransferase involved in cell wall biosynthesis